MKLSYNTQALEGREGKNRLDEMLADHEAAKSAKVGSTITCSMCKREFIKNLYQQVFCSNQYKKRDGRNCKDKHNNTTNPRGIYAYWHKENGRESA